LGPKKGIQRNRQAWKDDIKNATHDPERRFIVTYKRKACKEKGERCIPRYTEERTISTKMRQKTKRGKDRGKHRANRAQKKNATD